MILKCGKGLCEAKELRRKMDSFDCCYDGNGSEF